MNNIFTKNIVRFVLLVLLQVLVLNNIQLHQLINPFIYILFILLLPIGAARWMVLCASFLLGLTVDVFNDTGGIHAAACVLIAYIRPFILSLISPHGGYDTNDVPGLGQMGITWFTIYSVILVSIWNITYFLLEVFTFDSFFRTFIKILISTLISLVLIFVHQYLFYEKQFK